MKLNKINFESKDAKAIYENYLKQIQSATKKLSKVDQEDILLELNSHIYQSLSLQIDKDNEVGNLLNVLDKIGIPNDVLKPLIAEKKLVQATTTFNPFHVLQALTLNISNGIIYIAFSIVYFLLFIFGIMTIAKLFYPSSIGFFYKEGEIFKYGGFSNENVKQYEVLGDWFIPITLIICVMCYFLITLLLKVKRNLK
ncbi:hypothetical protein [Flavobacterium sp. T12S277]|uniref:hypothetical protein n=1 Tax=Flavobacterium sp. T12S277 TaxID=3402752 RepID=UPI003AEE9866